MPITIGTKTETYELDDSTGFVVGPAASCVSPSGCACTRTGLAIPSVPLERIARRSMALMLMMIPVPIHLKYAYTTPKETK